MLKVPQFGEGIFFYKVDSHRTDKVRTDTQTNHNNEEVGRERKSPNDTVERKGGVEYVEVHKEREVTRCHGGIAVGKGTSNPLHHNKEYKSDESGDQDTCLVIVGEVGKRDQKSDGRGNLNRFDVTPLHHI